MPLPVTSSMASDDGALYIGGPTSVTVSSVSLPDGALTTLYSDDKGSTSIALGSAALFVATTDGRILRLNR